MKAIVFELPMVGRAGDLVRSRLFPDTLNETFNESRVVSEELTILLSIYLNIGAQDLYEDYFFECDYYDECVICFEELEEHRVWLTHRHHQYHRLQVLDSSGLVVFWYEPLPGVKPCLSLAS